MGQSNAAVRQWMGNPKRFADLFNATVFDGEQVIREGMSAEDCLDGDLSSQIRTIWDDSYYSSLTGDYPVTLQVSNSAGDVCQVEIEMTVTEANDREENGKEYPLLSDYIVYTNVNQMIDPESLIIGIEKNGTEYL